VAPGKHDREELDDHLHGLAGRPAKPPGSRADGGEVTRPQPLGRLPEAAQALGQQQVQVDVDLASQDQVGDQRPRPDAAKVGQAGVDRAAHPGIQVGMGSQELARLQQPVAQDPVAHPKGVAPGRVAVQQRVIVGGGQAGHGGGHCSSTALAAAYSAARCSTDRCT
jgi:hypothetical protein